MLKSDRFSCSQKIWLKWDPPVYTIDCVYLLMRASLILSFTTITISMMSCTYHLEVAVFAALSTLLSIDRAPLGWVLCATILAFVIAWSPRSSLMWTIENSDFVVLHFSFSPRVKVSMSNRPSQPRRFFIIGILSSSFRSYTLVSSIFETSSWNLTVGHTYLAYATWILAFLAPALHVFASDFHAGLVLWLARVLFQCHWMPSCLLELPAHLLCLLFHFAFWMCQFS